MEERKDVVINAPCIEVKIEINSPVKEEKDDGSNG